MKRIQTDKAGIHKQHHKVPWIPVRLDINARRVPGRQTPLGVSLLAFLLITRDLKLYYSRLCKRSLFKVVYASIN